MTKNEALKKNFDLATDFNIFVAKNPSVVKNLPVKANIIFMTSGNSKINSYNDKLGKAILCEEKSPVFKAIKEKNSWKLEEMIAIC